MLPGPSRPTGTPWPFAERLAAQDPGQADWQRDLSVSYNKIGDVLLAQGDAPGALAAYRDALAIRERLAAQDPGQADWQRDLSVSYNKIGDVLLAQGDAPGALAAYRDALAILSAWRPRTPARPTGSGTWWFPPASWLPLMTEPATRKRAALAWALCLQTLRRMKDAGMFLDPPLVQLLKQLEEAKSSR